MEQQAQIYLQENRGRHETRSFRSLHTFNFGSYRDEYRQPLGNLYVLNDDTLAGGTYSRLQVEEDTRILLLPVTGSVCCDDTMVAPGCLLIADIPAGNTIRIQNPYPKQEQLVNCIQFWFRIPSAIQQASYTLSPFRLDTMDQLAHIAGAPCMSIGKYRGRSEDIYQVKHPGCAVYAFVIEGAFEAEGRLLHARDGLSLKNFGAIEFEALSNEAIIVLLEVELGLQDGRDKKPCPEEQSLP